MIVKIWPSINGARDQSLLPTAMECNVFTGVCLFTIGFMDAGSLLGLVTALSVGILLKYFVLFIGEQR